jgi:L-lactate dehydrogenase complex protein LldE
LRRRGWSDRRARKSQLWDARVGRGTIPAQTSRQPAPPPPPISRRLKVSLFVTCLVDQFWPEAGRATALLLQRAGCHVHFDERQTCCGQPAFNSGFFEEARAVARHFIEVFEEHDSDAIVFPSGSCTTMTRRWEQLFEEGDPWRARALEVAARCHELSSFLVRVLQRTDLGARFDGPVTWHDACHGHRELCICEEPRALLREVEGLELVEVESSTDCCGFGGTFSVKYPEISVAMLDRKLEAIETSGARTIVSGDVSCLMQIDGRLKRRGSSIQTLHLAELLAGGAE